MGSSTSARSTSVRSILTAVLVVVLVFALPALLAGCSGDDTESGAPDEAETISEDVTGDIPAPPEGVVQVVLSWDEPVDLDLEIWDSAGEEALTSSGLVNEDVMDGTVGSEYFEFVDQSDGDDFSEGEYVVSVYFAEETDEIDEARALLTVTQADGTVVTQEGTVYWEVGRDQWHAIRVDAVTGGVEVVDTFIETEVFDEE